MSSGAEKELGGALVSTEKVARGTSGAVTTGKNRTDQSEEGLDFINQSSYDVDMHEYIQ